MIRTWLLALQDSAKQSPMLTIAVVNGFALATAMLTSFVLVRLVPKADYGRLITFYASFGIIRLVVNFGLGMSVSRDVATTAGEPQRLKVVVYSTALLRLTIIVIFLALAPILANRLQQPILARAAPAAALASLADFSFSIITGLRRIWRVGLMTIVQPLAYLLLAMALVLVVVVDARAELLMTAYAFSYAFMFLLGLVLIVGSRRLPWPDRSSIRLREIRLVITFGLAAYVVSVVTQAWATSVSGGLGWFGRFEEAAEFGVVFTLASMATAVTGPTILSTFYPQVSHLFGSNQRERMVQEIRSAVQLLVVASVWLSCVLFAFPEAIVQVLFGTQYISSAPYLAVMAPLALVAGVFPVFTLTLFAVNRPWVALTGFIAQLLILLVPFLLTRGSLALVPFSALVIVSTAAGVLIQWRLASSVVRAPLIPRTAVMAAATGIILAGALRYVLLSTHVQVILWQIVIGVLFSAVYWGSVFMLRGLRWQPTTA